MPSKIFEHGARTAADRDEVWETLQRAETWASIAGIDRVDEVRRSDTGDLRGFEFGASVGSVRYRGVAETVDAAAPERMTLGIRSAEMSGTIRVVLEASSDGTRLTVTLTARSRGLVSAMAFPLIASAIGRGLPRSVDDFAASLDRVS